MIRGVLFDLDNTLVDFLRMKRLASEEAARAMIAAGAEFPFDPAEAGERLYDHYLETGIESDDAFLRFLDAHNRSRLSFGQSRQDKILAAAITAYVRAKELFLTPYPGVRPLLVELVRRGMRLGVVTDAPRLKGWQRLSQLALSELFDVVVTHDDSGAHKPDAAPFRIALDSLGLKPSDVVFVGDWPERDMRGARLMGMRTAFAKYGRPLHSGDAEADATIDAPGELLSLIDGWNQAVVKG